MLEFVACNRKRRILNHPRQRAMPAGDEPAGSAAAGGEDRAGSFWSLLPSFDPSVDNPKEYVEKVRFLGQVCPSRDKAMLGPRLAMLMKGTAWSQVTKLDASKLADPTTGIDTLLSVVAQWEEVEEIQTYEKFEKALYRIQQKADETVMSYVNRLAVAFQEIEKVSLSEVQAFILLRQSALNAEDKKRILSMTGGDLSVRKVDAAMRQLAPKVLVGVNANEAKKKVYPVNHVDEPEEEVNFTGNVLPEEEGHGMPPDEDSMIQNLADGGDPDAAMVAEFEDQILEAIQDNVDLSMCFSAYTEARTRIREKIKSRGFWPPRQGKGKKGGGKFGGKGSGFHRKQSLADRIANSNCRLCGAKGHWKQECPNKGQNQGSGAEVHMMMVEEEDSGDGEIVENLPDEEEPTTDQMWSRVRARAVEQQGKQKKQCRCCGKMGHWMGQCPDYVKKGQSEATADQDGSWEMMKNMSLEEFMENFETLETETALHDENQKEQPAAHESELRGKAGLGKSVSLVSVANEEFVLVSQTDQPWKIALKRGFRDVCLNGHDRHRSILRLEPVLFIDSKGCPAIIDTGASKSVIGQEKVASLMQSLPSDLQSRIKWKQSEVVFRFGNNATLPSVGALFIPFADRWMRLEVVKGSTPFLLSNAFLKAVEADVCTSTQELKMFGGGVRVALTVNRKGLFLVELSDILQKISGRMFGKEREVVTVAVDETQQTTNNTPKAARVARTSSNDKTAQVKRQSTNSDSTVVDNGIHVRSDGPHDRCTSQSAGRPSTGDCRIDDSSGDRQAAGHSDVEAVGRIDHGGWQASGQDVQPSCRRCELCEIHEAEDRLHLSMGTQLSELHPCHGSGSAQDAANDLGANAGSPAEEGCKFQHGAERGQGQKSGECGAGVEPVDSGIRPCGRNPISRDSDEANQCRDRRDGAKDGADSECRDGGSTPDADCDLAEGDRSAVKFRRVDQNIIEGGGSGTKGDVKHEEPHQSSLETQKISQELLMLSEVLEIQVEQLLMSTAEIQRWVKAPDESTQMKEQLDLLEVYCEEDSMLTRIALQHGLRAKRFTFKDGDLRTREGQERLWQLIHQHRPKHIWVSPDCKHWGNFSRFNMSRSQTTQQHILQGRHTEQPNLVLCRQLYLHQVSEGRHFHLEQPQGSEMLEEKAMWEIKCGTLRTVFDMCEVGKLKIGNNFLRKRSVVQTTSRTMHESLDCRYCRGRHSHRPIVGRIRYLGTWVSLSGFAARYSLGFARNVVDFLKGEFEGPVEFEELCGMEPPHKKREEHVLAGEVLKRRRLVAKQTVASPPDAESELRHKENRMSHWKSLFKRLDKVAPRVGSWVIASGDEIFGEVSGMCRDLHVNHLEVCRGTERFRIPKAGTPTDELPLRKTVVLHRTQGDIIEGSSEEWLKMPQRTRVRKNVPARLCLTIFGSAPDKSSEVSQSSRPSRDQGGQEKRKHEGGVESEEKKRCAGSVAVGEAEIEPPIVGRPPPNIARHGPRFLELTQEDKQWLQTVHHRLGHPNPGALARYLKSIKADERFSLAALDFQCDACVESRTGFDAARPGAVHEDVGFNHTVGVDVAHWTSRQGTCYTFFHMIDEGTLFHIARPSAEDAASQMRIFEDFWLNWAGPPRVVYCDPAKEYIGKVWLESFEREGIMLRVSASDAHWQLGRVEAHGSTIKEMLSRIDTEKPIFDSEAFRRALVQVCIAKNTLARSSGYSPEQAVLGVSRKLPGSVHGDEQAAGHLLAMGESPESDQFREALELRTAARKAFVETDNSATLRRVLLRRSRPIRSDFEVGDLVLYWKRKGGNMRRERGKWFGPARVVMVEGKRIVWLVHATKLVRASPEQLRAASMREWKEIRDQPEHRVPVQDWIKRIQHQDFADLGDEVPDAEAVDDEIETRPESTGSPEPEGDPTEPPTREISQEPPEEEAVPDTPDGVDVPVPEEEDDLFVWGHC